MISLRDAFRCRSFFCLRYPNTAKIYSKGFTGNADMPFDFFMSRCAVFVGVE